MNNRCYSSYLRTVFEPKLLKRSTKEIVKILKHIGFKNFDAIAFRGASGSLMAPVVSLLSGKPMIMVRKDGDGSHSGMATEGYRMANRVVIVDDLVSSGGTLSRTVLDLNKSRMDTDTQARPVRVVAIILYHSCDNSSSLASYQMSDGSRPFLGGVPVYAFLYEKDYTDESKMRYYCNSLVRNVIKTPEPTDGASFIYVDIP